MKKKVKYSIEGSMILFIVIGVVVGLATRELFRSLGLDDWEQGF